MANQNTYIISSKGFLKEIKLIKVPGITPYKDISWTHNFRDAKQGTKKQNKNILDKYNIDGFIWSPYKETPGKKQWEISLCQDFIDINKINLWSVTRAYNRPDSDINFIIGIKNPDTRILFDNEIDAMIEAHKRNTLILEEIKNRLNKQEDDITIKESEGLGLM